MDPHQAGMEGDDFRYLGLDLSRQTGPRDDKKN